MVKIRTPNQFMLPRYPPFLQLLLCLGGQDLFQEALNSGKVTEPGHYRVNYDDVFSSPWCCDSYFEERYEVLLMIPVPVPSPTPYYLSGPYEGNAQSQP